LFSLHNIFQINAFGYLVMKKKNTLFSKQSDFWDTIKKVDGQ